MRRRADLADPLASVALREPEVAVRPGRNVSRTAVRRRQRKLTYRVRRRVDLPDSAAIKLGEPEVAVGPHRNPSRPAVRRRQRELTHNMRRGVNLPDSIAIELCEPEIAVRPGRDRKGATSRKAAEFIYGHGQETAILQHLQPGKVGTHLWALRLLANAPGPTIFE